MTSPQDPFSTPSGGGPGDPPGQGNPPPYGQPPRPPSGGQPQYGQPQYGQPPYGSGPQGAPRNGMGVAALVLGILGLVTSWLIVGGVLGVVAIVLGVIGRRRAKRGQATNGGMALAGILTGVAAVLLALLVVVGTVALFNTGEFGSFTECIQEAQGQAEIDQCAADFEDSVTTG